MLIQSGLNAVNVDIKGNVGSVKKYCHADVEKVWRNCSTLKNSDVHLEVTTLMITGTNAANIKSLSGD